MSQISAFCRSKLYLYLFLCELAYLPSSVLENAGTLAHLTLHPGTRCSGSCSFDTVLEPQRVASGQRPSFSEITSLIHIGVDRKDQEKAFIQLTLEITTKQKFEAYNLKGAVVAGDKNKEVLVRDIWVFEKSLFHKESYWRVCGRLSPKAS
ncbi:hypothetical protein PIB30_026374 [Stylosanthes scabra]|uniref:Large ribosomal subunit protein mL45 n=1 Tax=Stylosanthes scabra TaxID=79078 RepID=A0ABU6QAJ8_9FABA|nr:hypothetical protein [Stylosanthes scabra]